ncbi:hypothetical protein [Piscinibacter koreensis]|uniref:Uncharacterized protein n=1 Tax=Piscinibacter koreensis TaxID=2742824 RepID=A0A7Y6NTR6_9BURK|nr:hypothetical protein [Schlegelella koreensis]NUZ09134.1 hypothetical protein [Schlegelella koreensis]
MLAALVPGSELRYPLRVECTGGSYFSLFLPTVAVGIDCARAAPEEWARILAARDQHDAAVPLRAFAPGHQNLASFEPQGLSQEASRCPRRWKAGDVLTQWAAAMAYWIEDNTVKLRAGSYARHATNWLLIDDGWPVSALRRPGDVAEAAQLCLSQVRPYLEEPCFARIFIASGRCLLSVHPNPLTSVLIPDLWSR